MSKLIGAISALFFVCLIASASAPPNLDRALEVQLSLARESPGDSEVQNDLGNLLVLDGRLDEAEGAYRRALELDETKVSARFNLALLLQNKGKTFRALREFRNVVDRDPDHAWAHYQAGMLYKDLGMDSRAVKSYTRAFQLDRSLTDPRVNPHIVQNSLHSKAMLEAYRKGMSQSAPPRTYDDPFRIAGLLVPEVKADPAPPEVVQEDDQEVDPETLTESELTEVSGASEGSGNEVEAGEPSEVVDKAPKSDRVITQESLDEAGPTNQASPVTGSGGRPTSTRGGQRTTVRGGSSTSRGKSVPSIRLPDPPSRQPPKTTPPRGGRTGTRSTGQLEIDLAPVRAS